MQNPKLRAWCCSQCLETKHFPNLFSSGATTSGSGCGNKCPNQEHHWGGIHLSVRPSATPLRFVCNVSVWWLSMLFLASRATPAHLERSFRIFFLFTWSRIKREGDRGDCSAIRSLKLNDFLSMQEFKLVTPIWMWMECQDVGYLAWHIKKFALKLYQVEVEEVGLGLCVCRRPCVWKPAICIVLLIQVSHSI